MRYCTVSVCNYYSKRRLSLYPYSERREEGSSRHSGHLIHEHRDPQALACCLTGQEIAPTLRQMSAFTVMLRALMRPFTGAREHRMLTGLLVYGMTAFRKE